MWCDRSMYVVFEFCGKNLQHDKKGKLTVSVTCFSNMCNMGQKKIEIARMKTSVGATYSARRLQLQLDIYTFSKTTELMKATHFAEEWPMPNSPRFLIFCKLQQESLKWSIENSIVTTVAWKLVQIQNCNPNVIPDPLAASAYNIRTGIEKEIHKINKSSRKINFCQIYSGKNHNKPNHLRINFTGLTQSSGFFNQAVTNKP